MRNKRQQRSARARRSKSTGYGQRPRLRSGAARARGAAGIGKGGAGDGGSVAGEEGAGRHKDWCDTRALKQQRHPYNKDQLMEHPPVLMLDVS